MSGLQQVRIVTDSTADIPADVRRELGIEMVPLKVLFGSESYRDAVDMSAEQFYDRLPSFGGLPTTSQPSPAEFMDVYGKLAEEGAKSIVSIHLSAAFSGTYQSAQLAASMMESGPDIAVVDSRSASYGIGLLAVEAAKAAREGKSKDEIVQLVGHLRAETRLYFLVDTLEYLQKGGRIGKASALVGSLLNIKPILSINDEGIVYSVDKVRGSKKAVARVIELLQKELGGRPVHLMMAHTNARSGAEEVYASIQPHFDVRSVQYTNIGPVIGAHVGPGTVAVFANPA